MEVRGVGGGKEKFTSKVIADNYVLFMKTAVTVVNHKPM
jgi:hypothetical protein